MSDSAAIRVTLNPDRSLLNADFETYKLSLDPLPKYEIELRNESKVQRSKVAENDDFTLQFVSLQRLHNHLVSDPWVGNSVVYFVDASFRVNCCSETDMRKSCESDVLKCRAQLPKPHQIEKLRYHPTIAFPSPEFALVACGTTYLWLFNTGKRTVDNSESGQWELLEEFDYADIVNDGFMLKDATYSKVMEKEFVSCLLVHVDLNAKKELLAIPEFDSSAFVTLIDWIVVARNSPEGAWEEISRRRLGGKHALLLAALETFDESSDALILASEGAEFRMLFDTATGVIPVDKSNENGAVEEPEPLYEWNQNADTVTVTMKLPDVVSKSEVNADGDGMWRELIKKCKRGKETVDPEVAAAVHERLAHLTSETLVSEAEPGSGIGLNQMEECDDLPLETSTLARFVCEKDGGCHISHKASLSSHQWIFSTKLTPESLPVVCLRHDVDAIVWEFKENEPDCWNASHIGTFDAFGYVFASKENRKYTVCPPDMSYVAICDSATHCYIYRKVNSYSELKNRKSGKHLPTVAKQFVLTLKHEEVLGAVAAVEGLFVMTDSALNYVALTGC
ncbi:unnamed protein product [Notodromas monacha]|uniref:NudC domain-containing protein 1 n=1 Tax=Notodromas monacha TaxID=399045 RepID=A0A7R9BEB3_9CRUS|nr:unnamed protein product [Notodromas monacha]CAG0912676.1 unnamed protein product [Notodromas monacha]